MAPLWHHWSSRCQAVWDWADNGLRKESPLSKTLQSSEIYIEGGSQQLMEAGGVQCPGYQTLKGALEESLIGTFCLCQKPELPF